ncbi:MAG: HEAT repeat domain-containing protein [Blastocatellia bacterium]
MTHRISTALLLVALLSVVAVPVCAQSQTGRTYTRADFISIDGGSLPDRIERAVAQFRASKQGDSCWIAWHFAAREGVQIGPFSGYAWRDEDGISLTRRESLEGAAVFLLAETNQPQVNFTRVKTLNISEPYLFENRPVYWLGNADTTQSLAQLESLMRADAENKPYVRSILRAISSHDSPRVIPLLKEIALKDQTFDIQRAAISGLARVGTKESLDALDELFGSVKNVQLRQEVMRAYAATGNRVSERRVLERLTAIAKSDDENSVRLEAIRLMAGFRGEAITDRLIEIYDGANNESVREEIINRLARNDSRKGTDKLMAIAKNDPNPNLRQKAVRRLTGSRTDFMPVIAQ